MQLSLQLDTIQPFFTLRDEIQSVHMKKNSSKSAHHLNQCFSTFIHSGTGTSVRKISRSHTTEVELYFFF